MSASDQTPPPVAAERRSKQIALVLLGTMGVVGGAAVWEAWQRAGLENNSTVTPPETPAAPLAADRDYPNNDFTPGVGYYHAPYRSWFPFPFGGGLWQAAPFAAGLLSSRPTGDAVTSALAAQARRTPEPSARAGTAGFARTSGATFGGSSFSSPARPSPATTDQPTGPAAPSARPAPPPAPATSKPSIQRGGFGSSGHSSGGSAGS